MCNNVCSIASANVTIKLFHVGKKIQKQKYKIMFNNSKFPSSGVGESVYIENYLPSRIGF